MPGFLTESATGQEAKKLLKRLDKSVKRKLRGAYVDSTVLSGSGGDKATGEIVFAFDKDGDDGGLIDVQFSWGRDGALRYRVREADTNRWSEYLDDEGDLVDEVVHLIKYMRKRNGKR